MPEHFSMWPHIELSVEISEVKEPTFEQYRELMRAAHVAMAKNMAQSLYADNPILDGYEPKPLSRREKISIYWNRVRDAWEVLRGRANIWDGY